jgi:hypothetical protein
MKRFSILAMSLVLALATWSVVQADDAPPKTEKPATGKQPAKPAVEVIPVTIHRAAAPRPALKYHLLPTFRQSTPGNAVPLYAKALLIHRETWINLHNSARDGKDKQFLDDFEHFEKWLETPPDKLPCDRVRKVVDSFSGTVRTQLELAVRREHCDWDMPLRQGHVFEIVLPEADDFRGLARIVALRARLQIAEGKYDEAIASLQTGYGMARHIAEEPFVVTSLVGVTITLIMDEQLLTLCQQPDAPNLYWSIAELPSPWLDRSTAIGAEYDGIYLQWPELQVVRTAQYTPDQWNLVLRKCVSEIVRYEGETIKNEKQKQEQLARIERIVTKALSEVSLSRAKTAMLAAGHTQKQLDAMPPAQIVMLYSLDAYDATRDESFKWWHLPYPQALEGMAKAEREIPKATKDELVPLATGLLSWVGGALHGFGRTDRQFAAIRVIEALRLYAAAHDGELPATLDAIREVPIPLNPMTGKPFPYHLEGKTAVLDADGGLTNTPRPQYRVIVAK